MNFINLIGMNKQCGGGPGHCSLCKSLRVNKSTCPLNPKAKNPNPSGHPLAKKKKRRIKRKSKQKKASPSKRKTSKSSSMSPTTKRQRQLRMNDQINRHIYHKQRDYLMRLLSKHPIGTHVPQVQSPLDEINMRIANMPPLIVQTRRKTRRGKTNFEATDILLDPAAADAVNKTILSAYATPAFVKEADTIHKDTITRWITDNADKYDIVR